MGRGGGDFTLRAGEGEEESWPRGRTDPMEARVERNAPRVAASFLQNEMKCNWAQGQFLHLDSPLPLKIISSITTTEGSN